MTWPARFNPFGNQASSRIRFPTLETGLIQGSLQSLPVQARPEVAPDTTSALGWARDHPVAAGLLGLVAWKVPILAIGLGAATWVIDKLCRGQQEVGHVHAPVWAGEAVHAVNRNSGTVAGGLALTSFIFPWVSVVGLAALAALHRIAAHLPNPRFGL